MANKDAAAPDLTQACEPAHAETSAVTDELADAAALGCDGRDAYDPADMIELTEPMAQDEGGASACGLADADEHVRAVARDNDGAADRNLADTNVIAQDNANREADDNSVTPRSRHSFKTAAGIAAALTITAALTFSTLSWGGEGASGASSDDRAAASQSESKSTSQVAESPIKLVQLERSADRKSLVQLSLEGDYLLPAVGGIAGSYSDDWGMPQSSAFVDMIVGAKNCLNESAQEGEGAVNTKLYTRVLVAVPAALETLDDPNTADVDESLSSPLHLVDGSHFAYADALDNGTKEGATKLMGVSSANGAASSTGEPDTGDSDATNSGNGAGEPDTTTSGNDASDGSAQWSNLWTHTVNPDGKITIDGVDYNVHVFTYTASLEPGQTTQLPAIVGFYLDPGVSYDPATQCLTYNGESTSLALLTGDIGIPTSVQAIEAGTFNSANLAFATHNPGTNPWDDNETLLSMLQGLLRSLIAD